MEKTEYKEDIPRSYYKTLAVFKQSENLLNKRKLLIKVNSISNNNFNRIEMKKSKN